MAKAPASVLDQIRAKYGVKPTEYLDTGLFQINELWGGGIPMGKIIEVFSQEGIGKTTICLQIASKLCSQGISVGYIDAEYALAETLKEAMGIDCYEQEGLFVHTQANLVKDVEQLTQQLLAMGCRLIIIDSLTAVHGYEPKKLNSKDEYGTIFEGQPVGSKSRVQAMYLEEFKPILKREEATMILINQMRVNITFHGRVTLEPAGGNAQKFYADIRTGLSRKAWIADADKVNIGVNLELMCIKNKMTAPYRAVIGNLYFGKGISVLDSIIDTLISRGVVIQSGAYFKHGELTFKGKVALKEYVRNNKDSLIEEAGGLFRSVPIESDETFMEEIDS